MLLLTVSIAVAQSTSTLTLSVEAPDQVLATETRLDRAVVHVHGCDGQRETHALTDTVDLRAGATLESRLPASEICRLGLSWREPIGDARPRLALTTLANARGRTRLRTSGGHPSSVTLHVRADERHEAPSPLPERAAELPSIDPSLVALESRPRRHSG